MSLDNTMSSYTEFLLPTTLQGHNISCKDYPDKNRSTPKNKALAHMTTGDNNVAIGYKAVYTYLPGNDNVAVGDSELKLRRILAESLSSSVS